MESLSSMIFVALSNSIIWSCSKRDLSFEWTEWISTTFPQNSSVFQCSISKLYLYQTQSRNPSSMHSTPNFTSPLSFQSAQTIHTENSSLTQKSSLQIVFSPSEASLAHRDFIRFKINITHELNLNQCFFAVQEAATSSPIWAMILFVSLKILIRLSHTNQTDSCYALGESMINLFLKRAKYDANNYHGKYFSQ
jgi:hypothetical protein